ncbi:unnamed protein product, partial [Vitis vinifera]
MSRDLDSPLQTQMAVATIKGTSCDCLENKRMERKPSARRRVFVQTETGSVLGIELDRSDNAYTVKKRLQLALNIPTEESSLTYGDTVLKNDLSAVRHDSPLLLTRKFLHRSSSTPCLSPTGRDLQQRDQSGPIEILGCSNYFAPTKLLVKDIVKAIENGIDPIPVCSGLGGSYYFRNCNGENVAIVKPTDEEPFAPNNPKGWVGKTLGQPGLKRSVRVGETGFREVAAYLLDYDHFSNVPSTALVKITHSIFNVNDRVELVPIDHGLCLPESLEDPYFEWIHWPQASIPFSEDELEYIDNLDPIHDSDMLRMELPMIREACLRVLVLCTTFLKEAAAFGLCLAEIGEMMSREFQAHKGDPSELEVICIEARRQLEEMEVLALERKVREEEFQFDMDCEDEEFDLIPSKEEKLEEAAAEIEGNGMLSQVEGSQVPSALKLSLSLENTKVGKKTWQHQGAMLKDGCLAGPSSGNWSVNEQLPASTSFELTDINGEDWTQFLEIFQKLLRPAFATRKSTSLGQRQRQRLGTSCQF